ncbi:MAG TPA: dihydroorotate dehydrogenase [Actinomycetota bacterium]|nr:dihydroorotate dehydrogenase [Actinomycetota bacterium]
MAVDLTVDLAGISLKNPVLSASGCFGSGKEISRFTDLHAMGAVVCKTVTLRPRAGIAPPRGAETPSGMLNAIGLQNPGVDVFRDTDLVWLAQQGVPAIPSAGGHSVDEYVAVVERLAGAPKVAVELNLSCPNLEERGYMFALDATRAAEVTRAVKAVADTPIFVKLSPDVTDLVAIARAVADAGADGITLINTTLGMSIDIATGRPKLSTGTGGLSGPAIRPIAVRCIFQVAHALPHVPILGAGGVASGRDAIEMIVAGATVVQVGTANFYDPRATQRIAAEIHTWCGQHGIDRIADMKGRVKLEG